MVDYVHASQEMFNLSQATKDFFSIQVILMLKYPIELLKQVHISFTIGSIGHFIPAGGVTCQK